jgi:glycosyltransferase involved in cell wall biosynthesis
MKIAFISYEYPPDTAFGGIATYVYQAAKMMNERGHNVEVFAASGKRSCSEVENGILVHRIVSDSRKDFRELIATVFAERNSLTQFDVLEGPEYGADAKLAIRLAPEIPLVVKLHTPTFMCQQLAHIEPPLKDKIRISLGALRRFKKPPLTYGYQYDSENDFERLHVLEADEIASPSISLGEKLTNIWELQSHKLSHLPNPYVPVRKLLDIPLETQTNVVSFLGRLEMRKGITDLATAIPLILKQCPNVKFRFVGKPETSPISGLNMQEYIENKLNRYLQSLEFIGAVSLENIPDMLSSTDICVFPSRWENFPNVCLEAMSAGRGIVGSSAGGMSDMLENGKSGFLVPPRSPKRIAKAVIKLVKNPILRMELGRAARDRVLSEYNADRIGLLQEQCYIRAIERRHEMGKRLSMTIT